MKKSGFLRAALCVAASAACMSSASAQYYSGDGQAALDFAGQVAKQQAKQKIKSVLPVLGEDQPEWLKRVELNWDFLSHSKPEQSILTVQPIYQSDDNADTVFFQGSVFHYSLYGDYRWTANLGTGYRRLMADNSLMLGVNAFYDNEFTYGHRRISFGGEARWNVFDFGFNDYIAVSGDKTASGMIERALSGRDFRLSTQLPYMPWAKVSGGYFWWDAERATKDMNGSTFTADFALHPNFNLSYKWSSYDVNNNAARGQSTLMLNFTLAQMDKPTLSTGPAISDSIFEKRDLSKETLSKVVRENRIIVERRTRGGSVVIARGD
ncbi:MAG: inverse autotransporter beta domain-containing protein [Alphaproteobacteria bacterium]|nr:inverse autotransporter beta domain-containing protein [Alphaproteobacteria bacterium]